MLPTTRYAKSGDVHVAYQVFGDGNIELVFFPGFVSSKSTGRSRISPVGSANLPVLLASIASVTLCSKIFDGEMQINFSDCFYDLTGAPRDWTCAGASFALSSTAS